MRVLPYDLAMGTDLENAGKAVYVGDPKAVEIVQNFHGLLHGFTCIALGIDVN
jgi:hypothetical protein